MHEFRRFAIYHAPRPATALGRFGASWLGWDAERGVEALGLDLPGLPLTRDEIVAAPAKYGFHATLKAPFRLAHGVDPAALDLAVARLAAEWPPVVAETELAAIDAFLAIVPRGPSPGLDTLAADCVRALDRFRAPLTEREIARRDPARLTARQAAHLEAWGYPYVLDEFRFHLTLTGALLPQAQAQARAALAPTLAPMLAQPLVVEDLCVFGEGADGRFRRVSRHPLRGTG